VTNTRCNYSFYRKDRLNSGHGGVALFIKKHILHLPLGFQKPSGLEALGVKLKLNNHGMVHIFSAYKPPDKRLEGRESKQYSLVQPQ
jgi:hypothetical protein